MTTTARVIADSIAEYCPRLTTFLVRFPHIILPQVLTHRVFSRNTSSSRAIPIERLIADVRSDPFEPAEWRYSADRGMQPGGLMGDEAKYARDEWNSAMSHAVRKAKGLDACDAAKEHANRLLEPFSHVNMVITATDWENWDKLRIDKHAQIEIRMLAQAMKNAKCASTPRQLEPGEWHLPFVRTDERDRPDAPMLSAARCARTSYLTHEGAEPDPDADARLAKRLLNDSHMSPFEHQAQIPWIPSLPDGRNGNFAGHWRQYRKMVEAREVTR